MAKNVTFKGTPKPYGESGHFNESRRHSLQAKGIKTGNLSKPLPIIDLGLLPDEVHEELEQKPSISFTVGEEPEEEQELEQDEVSFLQYDEPTVPDPVEEADTEEIETENQSKGFLGGLFEGFKTEKDIKSKKLKSKAFTQLGRESELEGFETPDFPSRGEKMGKILADLFADYNTEDLTELNDKEIEELAVKFDSHSSGVFGKPHNPFLDELKGRMKSRERIKLEKAQLNAEFEGSRVMVNKKIQEARKQVQDRAKGEGDIFERLFGF